MHAIVQGRDQSSDARAPFDWWAVLTTTREISWTRSAGRTAVAAAAARRVADLVEFARANSPFYRNAWRTLRKSGISLGDLPVVTKRELMMRFDDWVTDRSLNRRRVERFLADRKHIGEPFFGRFIVWKSSGSSGEPGIFVQDPASLATYDALLAVQVQSAQLAGRYAWGLVAHGGRAALVAATGDHFASIASWQRVCRGIPWPSARAFSVMDPLPALVDALNAYQPAFLASYPTTLALLAGEQREGRLQISPTCVWSGGEDLSLGARAAIERAFGAVLVNEYGASECMSIAFSCPRGSLHVNADWVLLEPVGRDYRPTPPGEPSHTVLLTNLANRIQPIIRYDLGDSVTASVGPCACGGALPAIRAEGRREDVLGLRARDGRIVKLSPLALTTVIEEAVGRDRFQVVQRAPDCIAVRLGARDRFDRSARWRAVRRVLRAFLASQSLENVRIALDPNPPMTDPRSGKLREVIGALDDAATDGSERAIAADRPGLT